MRVLVVEDFEVLARSIGTGLRREGMAVDVVLDGTDALDRLAATRYDVVILDRDLPGVDGDEICRRLAHGRSGTRVLMLTAAGTIEDRVDGLSLGADDYLPKPFAFAELVARVRALARRATPPLPPTLSCGDITLDPARRVAFRAGRRLELSPKEFALLECLLAAPGLVLPAEELLERVWDEAADPFTSAVKHTIHRLRAKLGDPPVIETVREGGYRIGPMRHDRPQPPPDGPCRPGSRSSTPRASSPPGSWCSPSSPSPSPASSQPLPRASRASGAITGTGTGSARTSSSSAPPSRSPSSSPSPWRLGWFVAGRFLQPLRAITATARAISAGNLHQRLDLGEPADELTELGHILDDLFARLEASFDAQRHFVANASHELRTPLAGLRTLLEVTLADPDADAGTLRSACQEALALGGHQERLVQALLALATSERGVTRRDTLDLAQVVAGVLASRRDQAAETGIDLAEHLTPAVTAGDPGLIESLIANLIDNAIRHNHPDGHVEITTQTSGTQATLTVTNSGPVIPDDQIQRLFQPFQRLAPDRHAAATATVSASPSSTPSPKPTTPPSPPAHAPKAACPSPYGSRTYPAAATAARAGHPRILLPPPRQPVRLPGADDADDPAVHRRHPPLHRHTQAGPGRGSAGCACPCGLPGTPPWSEASRPSPLTC